MDDIWEVLSSIWTDNADKVITRVGSSDKPEGTIFENVELPVLTIRGKYDKSVDATVAKAVESLQRKRPADEELAEVEKLFKGDFAALVKSLDKRRAALDKLGAEDRLERLYKLMSRLSNLSH